MPPSGSKPRAFRQAWCLKYGIRVSSRCSQSGVVVSAKCLFCERFGKDASEQEHDRKRKRSGNVVYFKAPWRTDNIHKHMKEQHNVKYAEYLEAPAEVRKSFFDSTDATFLPLRAANDTMIMLVDKKIVEIIIGDMLLDVDSDDDNLNSTVVALRIFQLQEEDANSDEVGPNYERYLVAVPNLLQSSLVVKCIRAGLSFRQCCATLHTKETTHLGQIGCINSSKVIAYTRYICAMAYQMISDVLKSVWAFSIALDGGNKSSTSYLDVRIRLSVNEVMRNIHLVALPMRERHTGQYVFNIVSEFFDVLCENWESKLIGITSDGTSSMTVCRSGVVTRLHQVSLPGC